MALKNRRGKRSHLKGWVGLWVISLWQERGCRLREEGGGDEVLVVYEVQRFRTRKYRDGAEKRILRR
jgi:hypothetical protein